MKREIGAYAGNLVGMICTAIQPDELLQIISLVLTIVATLFSIAFTVCNWWKKAKDDGKIDKEEIDELVNIVDKAKEDLNNEISRGNNKTKK